MIRWPLVSCLPLLLLACSPDEQEAEAIVAVKTVEADPKSSAVEIDPRFYELEEAARILPETALQQRSVDELANDPLVQSGPPHLEVATPHLTPARLATRDSFFWANQQGLTIVDGPRHNDLRFGASMEATKAFADAVFRRKGEAGRNEECPAGPLDFLSYGNAQLLFQDGRFTGWSLNGPATYMQALPAKMGDIRSEIPKDILPFDIVEDSTLGTEFTLGEGENLISGLLSEPGPDGKVTNLWAGVSCVFR